jgi:hypothetical protein
MSLRSPQILVMLGSSLLFAACGPEGVNGNGQRTTETRPLAGFSNVSSSSSLDVSIARGDAFRVEVSIDSNLQALVATRVDGPTLSIDVTEGVGRVVDGSQVTVTMPTLGIAEASGSGRLSAAGFAQDEPVDLTLEGSGLLSFDGNVPAARVRSSGSGEARLTGIAASLSVDVEGSGTVDSRDLTATTADLSVSGSGNLAALVTGSVRVAISGSGSVDLFGGATVEQSDDSGDGTLRRH